MNRLRGCVAQLGPYQSLALLLVPLILIEPLKVLALIIAGEGHWLTGTGVLVGAYAISLLFIERLFRIVKPKLMTLAWFANMWARFTGSATAPVFGLTRPKN